MSQELEDTPTAESKAPTTELCEIGGGKLIWGRLYSTIKSLNSLDLQKDTYSFGRMLDCDVVLTNAVVPENRLLNISKKHFVITRGKGMPTMLLDLSKNGTFVNGQLVGRNKMRVLQNDDKIAVSYVSFTIYIFKLMASIDNTYLPPKLQEKYVVSRVLGQGACGEVRLIYDKHTCECYAVKKIMKSKTASNMQHLNHPARIENEIQLLKTLSHDCIVELREIEETETHYFIVLEYLEGGELTDRIRSVEPFPESTAKFLFYQIVLAVQYLHSRGVTHRDLKPQNVLLVGPQAKTRVKVSDFGLSKVISGDTCLRTQCGTPHYLAPEIWDKNCKGYDEKVDVWSLGVILFYMLARELPFKSDDLVQLAKSIISGDYNFENRVWGRVSKEAKDLVQKMLAIDPKKRISVNEILTHSWIGEDLPLQNEVAKMFNYIPDSSQSGFGDYETFGPVEKKIRLEGMMGANLVLHSWP